MRSSVVQRSLTLVQRVPHSIPGRVPPPPAHLTCGTGAVDYKDFTVSSDQGNI